MPVQIPTTSEIRTIMREVLAEQRSQDDAVQQLGRDSTLHPDHAYNYEQVAQFLGQKVQSVRCISPGLLPRIGHGRVLGIDLMAFRGEITYDEARAYKQARREQVLRVIS